MKRLRVVRYLVCCRVRALFSRTSIHHAWRNKHLQRTVVYNYLRTNLSQGRFPDARNPASRFALLSSAASKSETANPWNSFIADLSRFSPLGPIGTWAPTKIPCFFSSSKATLLWHWEGRSLTETAGSQTVQYEGITGTSSV